MSATNHTSTIELSQYISTDKPTYLTDYNGDMLKIDNAIASDRDGISTAQNKANTADGKADANKLSIDTLNTQINGDPTDPSDTGLAGKVTDNSGDIDTIEALLGNGTPTTSNQTVIGAINGLEGAIAPREDGADLANSYAEGEQFARGGSVYTALTSLTAGTPFASLTLNTDYKNSDTLIEQLAEKSPLLTGKAVLSSLAGRLEVVADGVKSYSALIDELYSSIMSMLGGLPNNQGAIFNFIQVSGRGEYDNKVPLYVYYNNASSIATEFVRTTIESNDVILGHMFIRGTGNNVFAQCVIDGTPSATFSDLSASVPSADSKLILGYTIIDIL